MCLLLYIYSSCGLILVVPQHLATSSIEHHIGYMLDKSSCMFSMASVFSSVSPTSTPTNNIASSNCQIQEILKTLQNTHSDFLAYQGEPLCSLTIHRHCPRCCCHPSKILKQHHLYH